MKRSKAIELGQPILAKFCGATVAGVPPRIMGIGPSAAIPKLLQKFQLTKEDIDIFEINEAFASMAVYCVNVLGLDHAKVNPRGGAIALGHPLGATGARQICTILSEARRTKKKILVTSMCVSIPLYSSCTFQVNAANLACRSVPDKVWLVSSSMNSYRWLPGRIVVLYSSNVKAYSVEQFAHDMSFLPLGFPCTKVYSRECIIPYPVTFYSPETFGIQKWFEQQDPRLGCV